ncbi:MAG: CotH kinase family protein [Bacillota bacterium]|nr:CotH kinase family protein [Bacillota bacterium]
MIQHKYIDGICIAAALLAALLVLLFSFGEQLGIQKAYRLPAYVERLFDDSRVHSINLEIKDLAAFLENAEEEEYIPCNVEIDGELFQQVGVRAKGNNSLRLSKEYGLSRLSLKLEFDQFQPGGSYYGLDKFSLDSSFQDNSYLKSYLAYSMMDFMAVPSPLCSFVWLQINGEDWGLFLAVEEPEEAFARRNFGRDHGRLYKPDYRSLHAENADLALKYIDDDPASYPNIFENAKFKTSPEAEQALIRALKTLSTGEDLESAVEIDQVLRYFVVQVFVMNWDSYLGPTGHNYFLYEEEGKISILPWDYNLAFGTYALGMSNPIRDPEILINYPINTPAEGQVMLNRPLYHELMKHGEYFAKYHSYFADFLRDYFESGRFQLELRQTAQMIAPYVEKDPTAYCSYEDHLLAVETLESVCLLRAESIKGQLQGEIPATIRGQQEEAEKRLPVELNLRDLGDFADLENAKEKQDAALKRILEKK